jgi:hypothetical protein
MPASTVSATKVVLQISENLTAPFTNWKTLVCETDSSSDHATNVTETKTKCGTFTAVDTPTNTISGNGVVNTTPEADEISYQDLLVLLNNKTEVTGRYFNLEDGETPAGAAVFMRGKGRVSSLGTSNTEGDLLKFSYGFTFNGTPLFAPDSNDNL